MDSSPPGSSVHGISQARTLEWVATLLPRGSSTSRDRTRILYTSCIARGFFTTEPPWKDINLRGVSIFFKEYFKQICACSTYQYNVGLTAISHPCTQFLLHLELNNFLYIELIFFSILIFHCSCHIVSIGNLRWRWAWLYLCFWKY